MDEVRHAGGVGEQEPGGPDSPVTLESVHSYLRAQFNRAVRRPGAYGGAVALQIYLNILCVSTGELDRIADDLHALAASSGAFGHGISAAFAALWPDLPGEPVLRDQTSDMAASVLAGIGHRHGWLDLDRALTSAEHDHIRQAAGSWCGQDRTAADVLGAFGTPSVVVGRTAWQWPKTLLYATDEPADPCLYFHLWNYPAGPQNPGAAVFAESTLLAIRTEERQFEDSFILTPTGRQLAAALGRQ